MGTLVKQRTAPVRNIWQARLTLLGFTLLLAGCGGGSDGTAASGGGNTVVAAGSSSSSAASASSASSSSASSASSSSSVAPPTALQYPTPDTFVAGAALAPISPTVTGAVSAYTVSPALPAGLVFDPATGQISGTPAAASADAKYVITAANAGGSSNFVIDVMVLAGKPTNLRYSTPVTVAAGDAMAPLDPTVTGSVTSWSVSPTLPSGVTLDSTSGRIAGTPTVTTAQTVYTVTAAGAGGSTSFALTLEVRPPIGTYNIGFQIITLPSGLKAGVWYPTQAGPAVGHYASGPDSDFVANATPLAGQARPLVIYVHGDQGCALQSVFINEGLARRGFIVAAMDHADSLACSVDGGPARGPDPIAKPGYEQPALWTESTVIGRHDDVIALTNFMLNTDPWRSLIDAQQVGLAGYSLGGYTSIGLIGGRSSWYDPRFKAAMLMAPYTAPYLQIQSLGQIGVPVMIETGAVDTGFTPYIVGPVAPYAQGSYDALRVPKYLFDFRYDDHWAWTTTGCPSSATLAQCMQSLPDMAVMTNYAAAFFVKYLEGIDQPLLRTADPTFIDFRYSP